MEIIILSVKVQSFWQSCLNPKLLQKSSLSDSTLVHSAYYMHWLHPVLPPSEWVWNIYKTDRDSSVMPRLDVASVTRPVEQWVTTSERQSKPSRRVCVCVSQRCVDWRSKLIPATVSLCHSPIHQLILWWVTNFFTLIKQLKYFSSWLITTCLLSLCLTLLSQNKLFLELRQEVQLGFNTIALLFSEKPSIIFVNFSH